MPPTAIIALLQEARIKINGYATSGALELIEKAIIALSGYPSVEEVTHTMLHYAGESSNDTEEAHVLADRLLCDIAKRCGYGRAVQVFEDMYKWYA